MARYQNRKGARIALPALKELLCVVCALMAPLHVFAQTRYESTVRGIPLDAPGEDRAADASVITDDRTRRTGESLAQLLAELPGVSVLRTGGIGSLATLSLRGSTRDQVGVYLDGVPLNAGIGGGVDLSTLPLGDVERVEVYRGASPLAFGGSALGGILSVTTRVPKQSWMQAELGAGSFETFWADARGAFAGRKLRLYAGAHYLTSRGDFLFTSDGGTAFDPTRRFELTRDNNSVREASGVLRVLLPITAGRELVATSLAYFRDQGLAGYGTVRQTRDAKLGSVRALGTVVYDSRRDLGSGGRLRAQVYYLFGRLQYRDLLGEISILPAATNDQTSTVGANLHLSRPLGDWLLVSGILDGRYELFRPYDAEATPSRGAPSLRLFGGAGVEADALVRKLRLHIIPSVRIETIADTRTGRDSYGQEVDRGVERTATAPAGRLAFLFEASKTVFLRANVARYARFPSTTELFGDSGFLLGNPTLAPESGWNADLGAHLHLDRGRLSLTTDVTLFASFVDGLIQFQQDSYGRARAANLGRARILGGEMAFDARLSKYGRLSGSATFMDGRDVSDTRVGGRARQLPNHPRFHLFLRPEGRLPLGHELTLAAYVDLDAADGNYLDPANLVALPARVLVGAGLSLEVARPGLLVIASGQNLGDARVFDFAGFPLPSRALFVSIRFQQMKEKLE
jgi:outer membrane cobalamin receptor